MTQNRGMVDFSAKRGIISEPQGETKMILSLQVIGLFFGIWFTSANVGKITYGHPVCSSNFVIMSAAWTLFIAVTWLI